MLRKPGKTFFFEAERDGHWTELPVRILAELMDEDAKTPRRGAQGFVLTVGRVSLGMRNDAMQKIPAVEEAKTLFEEAREWSVWRWLMEKRRARAAADSANEALDEAKERAKKSWSEDARLCYRELQAETALDGNAGTRRKLERAREAAAHVGSEIKTAVRRFYDLEQEAWNARMTAEATFDEADRRLSASLAREGTGQAIESWLLHEKVIRKAESVARLVDAGHQRSM